MTSVQNQSTDSLSDVLLIFFDIETNGLNPARDDILEIAATGTNGSRFHSFAKPVLTAGRVNEFVTKLTGITTEMVSTGPTPSDAVRLFLDWIMGQATRHVCLVGYNAVRFDLKFIQRAAAKPADTYATVTASNSAAPRVVGSVSLFDAFLFAQKVNTRDALGIDNLKQKTLYKALHEGVEPPEQHRAMGDVVALEAIMYKQQSWTNAAIQESLQYARTNSMDKRCREMGNHHIRINFI